MDYFTTFRYFEEFEKRIPRAEMENMEVIKLLDLSIFVIISFISSFLMLCAHVLI